MVQTGSGICVLCTDVSTGRVLDKSKVKNDPSKNDPCAGLRFSIFSIANFLVQFSSYLYILYIYIYIHIYIYICVVIYISYIIYHISIIYLTCTSLYNTHYKRPHEGLYKELTKGGAVWCSAAAQSSEHLTRCRHPEHVLSREHLEHVQFWATPWNKNSKQKRKSTKTIYIYIYIYN